MLVENIATTEFFWKQNLEYALLKRKSKMFMIASILYPKPPPE